MPAKTIALSPELMRIGTGTRRKKNSGGGGGKKLRAKTATSSDRLRKKLEDRIRSYQQRAGKRASGKPNRKKSTTKASSKGPAEIMVDTEPSSAFDDSLAFLQGLATATEKIPETAPGSRKNYDAVLGKDRTDSKNTDPPYGVLKNGSKPTYREWKRRTQKVGISTDIDPAPEPKRVAVVPDVSPGPVVPAPGPVVPAPGPVVPAPGPVAPAPVFEPIQLSIKPPEVPVPPRSEALAAIKKARKADRKKHKPRTLGKRGKNISVLICNQRTRKARQREQGILRSSTIAEVKEYLRERNLIKAGTSAPNDVLRSMYEDAILAGKVTNTHDDTVMHNYMESEK